MNQFPVIAALRHKLPAKPASRLPAALLLAALLLAGCTQPNAPTPTPAATPLPPIQSAPEGGVVRASAKVAPADAVQLAFPTAGQVQTVTVQVGDKVEAGGLLAALNAANADAAVVSAQTALFKAQASLEKLQAGARPQEVAAAESRLQAAQARLMQLTTPAAQADIAAARADIAAANAALAQLSAGPRTGQEIEAKANLASAQAAVKQATSAYNRVKDQPDVGMLPESRALQEATIALEAAQARYNDLFAGPDADQTAAAQARVQQAQAALDRLLTPATEAQVAEAEAAVRGAMADLDLLKSGATKEDVAIAAVAVTDAEAALRKAESAQADTQLRAPFAGTVTAVATGVGEMVQPGQVLFTLADLSALQVETTDLSERDVPRVAVGQPAQVQVDALGSTLRGHVIRIAPEANVVGGDVVYTVVIVLDELPPALRWGMSAEVAIGGE